MLGSALLLLTVASCGAADEDVLLVGAASDLARAIPAVAAAFEEETGTRVTVTLGSSGQLAQQVLEGAPIDLFLSADRVWVDRLAAAGRTGPEGRAVYARGPLALATGPHRARPFESLAELDGEGVGRVAIANPEHAPYGRAAREALRAAGVWDSLDERLVIAENVRQTLQFLGTGNVDAAITAVALMDDDARWVPVPDSLHAPLVQEGAVIYGRHQEMEAGELLRFLAGPRGREILLSHGFLPPNGQSP